MTTTDTDRKVQKQRKFGQFVQEPWIFVVVGLVISSLAKTYFWSKSNPLIAGGALSLCVIAGLLAYSKLRNRGRDKPMEAEEPVSDNKVAMTRKRVPFDLWDLAVLLLATFGTDLARKHGWLGNYAIERTDLTIVLGVVFIWALSRMWWRNRKQRLAEEKHENH
jgi:hypothetical protein